MKKKYFSLLLGFLVPTQSFIFYNPQTLNNVSINNPAHTSLCNDIRALDNTLYPYLAILNSENLNEVYGNSYNTYRDNFKTILEPFINFHANTTIESFTIELRTVIENLHSEASESLTDLSDIIQDIHGDISTYLEDFISLGSTESFDALYNFYSHLHSVVNYFKTSAFMLPAKLWISHVILFNFLMQIKSQLAIGTQYENEDIFFQLGMDNIDHEYITIDNFRQRCIVAKTFLLESDSENSSSLDSDEPVFLNNCYIKS